MNADRPLNEDLLRGAEAIGLELGVTRQTVAHLIDETNIPVFKIGTIHCARRSTLKIWIEAMEWKALRRRPDPTSSAALPIQGSSP